MQNFKKSSKGIYPFGANFCHKFTNFGDLGACKCTFLKPQPWSSAWGYRPGTLSPVPNFVKKSLREICPLAGNFYQKFEIFAIFSYLSPRFYTHNVKILLTREQTDLWIYQRHKISSKSHKGPASIALSCGGDAYCFLVQNVCFWEMVTKISNLNWR